MACNFLIKSLFYICTTFAHLPIKTCIPDFFSVEVIFESHPKSSSRRLCDKRKAFFFPSACKIYVDCLGTLNILGLIFVQTI